MNFLVWVLKMIKSELLDLPGHQQGETQDQVWGEQKEPARNENGGFFTIVGRTGMSFFTEQENRWEGRKPGRNKSAGRNSGHDSCCDCRPSNVTSRILLTDNCGEMELDWVWVWFLFGTLSSWIVTCQMRRGSRTGNGGDGGAAGGMLPLVGKGGESR